MNPSTEARQLSGGQRQGVSIARATAWGARAIIMDEPTAALGVRESERVMDVIRTLRGAKLCVLLVSHNVPQVLAVADRIWVLRAGDSSPTGLPPRRTTPRSSATSRG